VPKVAVLNADDRSYPFLVPIPADRQVSYALEAKADVTATDLRLEDGERTFVLHAPGTRFPIRTRLAERYNVYNILAAASAALALDVPQGAIQEGVYALQAVSGHMERIEEGQDFRAIVDFAHSPNALEQALVALRAETEGKLIVVFGCAGERDVLQRPMMGGIAGRLADVTVITAEDPRTEDLDEIIDVIAQGCERAGAREGTGEGARYYRVPDRVEAIAFAVGLARPGDVVVAAGKGHEQSMCFGTVEYPWDDRVVMRAALLERMGKRMSLDVPRLPTARE
jgi:UDP-N-acetylmuramoyl-L-alanyl-D-glutamate--2,6-diaminopimelate ligase